MILLCTLVMSKFLKLNKNNPSYLKSQLNPKISFLKVLKLLNPLTRIYFIYLYNLFYLFVFNLVICSTIKFYYKGQKN